MPSKIAGGLHIWADGDGPVHMQGTTMGSRLTVPRGDVLEVIRALFVVAGLPGRTVDMAPPSRTLEDEPGAARWDEARQQEMHRQAVAAWDAELDAAADKPNRLREMTAAMIGPAPDQPPRMVCTPGPDCPARFEPCPPDRPCECRGSVPVPDVIHDESPPPAAADLPVVTVPRAWLVSTVQVKLEAQGVPAARALEEARRRVSFMVDVARMQGHG